jgi:hypothetical protein
MTTEWKTGLPKEPGIYWGRSKEYKCYYLILAGVKQANVMIMRNESMSDADYEDIEFGPMLEVPDDGV